MKRKGFFIVVMIALSLNFIGCADEENALEGNSVENGYEKIILQERSVDYPVSDYAAFKLEKVQTKATKSSTDETNFKDFIGHSFRLDEYPYEDGRNIGFPVIDMKKYLSDFPNAVTTPPVKNSNTFFESYAGYERYEEKINKTKTVSSGFKLDFKVFSIGSKKKRTEVFLGSDIQESKHVSGELSVMFYDRHYQFNVPTSTREDIFEKYIDKEFTDKLYRNSTDEILKYYGGFVLIKFLTGGQAYALYDAEYKSNTHNEESKSEKDLNTEINATIDLKDKGQSESQTKNTRSNETYKQFNLGRTPGTGSFETNSFKKIRFSVRTIGGLPGFTQFTAPKEIDEVTFNLTNWCNSLSNKQELTIVELPQESLIPLADFIEEDNLKEAFYRYYELGNKSANEFTYLQEPCISIRMVFYNQQMACYETSLKTRYGDYIALRRATMFPMEAQTYLKEETTRIGKIFPNLKIEGMPKYYLTLSRAAVPSDDLNEFNTDSMTKFIDSQTGKIYLLTTVKSTGQKRAYTLYNDRIVDDYVFKTLINKLPTNNNVDLKSIRKNYYIVAL
ncbi:hypothetical protein FACS1894169_15280 [Bacteroidia bacterium]|nr:hypothetical protein FACS1894169_15280 [Bacteroidia bacterium]